MKRGIVFLLPAMLLMATAVMAASLYTGYVPNTGGAPLPASTTPLPNGATALLAVNNSSNAAVNCFLTAVPGKTAYITGFRIVGLGATGAGTSTVNINSLMTGNSWNYVINIPAGVTVPITPLIENFPMPVAANAQNTAIQVSATAFGSGNTTATCVAFGFLI